MTALDIPTMERWALIMRVFIVEYMGMQPDLMSHKVRDDRAELVCKAGSVVAQVLTSPEVALTT